MRALAFLIVLAGCESAPNLVAPGADGGYTPDLSPPGNAASLPPMDQGDPPGSLSDAGPPAADQALPPDLKTQPAADLAGPVADLAPTVDMAQPAPDLAGPVADLATPPGLASPPDLTTPPDLTPPPADMTPTPDLTPPPCGHEGEACCSGLSGPPCSDPGTYCSSQSCQPCGAAGQVACPGNQCQYPNAPVNGYCVAPTCGLWGLPCCPPVSCGGGVSCCTDGHSTCSPYTHKCF